MSRDQQIWVWVLQLGVTEWLTVWEKTAEKERAELIVIEVTPKLRMQLQQGSTTGLKLEINQRQQSSAHLKLTAYNLYVKWITL